MLAGLPPAFVLFFSCFQSTNQSFFSCSTEFYYLAWWLELERLFKFCFLLLKSLDSDSPLTHRYSCIFSALCHEQIILHMFLVVTEMFFFSNTSPPSNVCWLILSLSDLWVLSFTLLFCFWVLLSASNFYENKLWKHILVEQICNRLNKKY